MFRKELAERPLMLWILAAMSAPLMQLLTGYDWKSVILLGIVCTAVVCLGLSAKTEWGVFVQLLQLLWLTMAVAAVAEFASYSWPVGETKQIIPITLLGLAAFASHKGAAVTARIAGVLLILTVAAYCLVLSSGAVQIRWEWTGERSLLPIELGLFLFLMPAAAASLPGEKTRKRRLFLFIIPVAAALGALVVSGNLHPDAAIQTFPFYEMCRSLSLLGLAERFEALACAVLTIGWFGLLSFLFAAVGSTSQKIFTGHAQWGIDLSALAAAGVILGKMHIEVKILALGAVIFWGLLPIISQVVGVIKNSGKK